MAIFNSYVKLPKGITSPLPTNGFHPSRLIETGIPQRHRHGAEMGPRPDWSTGCELVVSWPFGWLASHGNGDFFEHLEIPSGYVKIAIENDH